MKEQYYDLTNIDKKATKFAEYLNQFRKKHTILLDKKKSVLLVIDMQKFFTDGISHAFIPSVSAIIPRIKKLQDYFLQNDLIVIQTKHINTIKNSGKMGKWYDFILSEDNPLSEITSELIDARVITLNKTQYDAFWKTDLYSILQDKGIEQLIITGVMTHLCCETTARSAFVRGFDVFFTIDGTATYNESFHLSSLINLSHGFAIPLMCDEVLKC